MGRNSKSKPKARPAQRGSQARPSDPLQKLKCSQHYSHAKMLELNQKRLQIRWYSKSITCMPCVLELKITLARRYDYGDSWVCLECLLMLCGGGGFSPEGHVRAHHKEEPEHRWFANYKNPDELYCRECNQEVPLKVFKYRPAKSAEASTELEPITDQLNLKDDDDGGLGPNTNTFDLKDDDGLDKKDVVTQQMKPVGVEGKGSSSPSSTHSEDITKEDVANTFELKDDDGLDKKDVVTQQMKPVEVEGKGSSSPSSTHSEDITKEDVANTFDLKDDDGLDKKDVVTQQMKPVEAEGKGSSSPSSTHSEDITKEDVANTFDLKDDDGLDKKDVVTQQMKPVEAEGKGSSSPSSTHSEDITKEDVAKYNVIRGLPNPGNTCFFNAMLQCLLALDPLRSIMMGQNVCKGPIAALFKELFVDTSPSSNAKGYLDQRKLFASVCSKWPQFSTGGMEDAVELIQCFLDGLDEEEDEARQPSMGASKKVAIINSIFAGEECSALTSTECVHSSKGQRQETRIFCLPIPDRKLPAVASRSNKADAEAHDGDKPVSVEDCFSLYTEEELVSDWVCDSCTDAANTERVVELGGDDNQNNQKQGKTKVFRAARKRMIITRAPNVMVISLMRQKKVPNPAGYDKLEGHVSFKETLNMQPYIDKRFDENDNNTYRLVGVAQHIGVREAGHYIVYCSNHDAQSSANVTCEESRLANLLPTLPNLDGDSIRPPMDDLVPWAEQRNPSRDKRREQVADKKNATLLPMFWEFLDEQLRFDRFTLSGETMPYYRFQLWGMLVRGSGSRELPILYSHLLSRSKDLAMGVCNGGERLRVKLTEIARKYMLELVTSLSMVVTDSTRNLMQQLELRFLEMPTKHEELTESLGAALLREMDVYGHVGDQIMIPLPDKCAVIQGLTEHVISKHRDGYSWEGDFGIEDVDVYDGKVVITKSPKLFEILPQISPEMVTAMEKDFDSIAIKVLKKKFTHSDIYVPYLLPFHRFLSGMERYAKWWSDRVMTKDLRELILHFPFYKPLRARMNLLVGIFDAWRSFDGKDMSTLIKKILERAPHASAWLDEMKNVENQIILDVFCYKDKNLSYYEEKLHFMVELFRHLAVHGTEKSFEYQYDGSRKQMVQTLDELEVGGAYYLEGVVVEALTALLEESAMKDIYINCQVLFDLQAGVCLGVLQELQFPISKLNQQSFMEEKDVAEPSCRLLLKLVDILVSHELSAALSPQALPGAFPLRPRQFPMIAVLKINNITEL
uniref:Ubiquitinyl hydrolase 1 n=1 Tax=Aegilops tauschii TaxID=37682 RepID=R7WD83_AEGTA